MQEETTNPIEELSEDNLQSITGGCLSCDRVDGRILNEAHRTLQEYRSNPQAVSAEQFHLVRSQGAAAAVRILDRHPDLATVMTIVPRAQGFRIHPNDPPLPHRGPGQ